MSDTNSTSTENTYRSKVKELILFATPLLTGPEYFLLKSE